MPPLRLGLLSYAIIALMSLGVVSGFVFGVTHKSWTHFWLALAMMPVLSVILMVFDWARHAPRRKPHECPRCHYDRRGIGAENVCPECGYRP